jgi:xanthine dehydrogenase YagR molybdenum-binding subunit
VFAEVRVDPDFGTIRVPRIVGAYDVGRVITSRIVRSQCIGGMVGGIGLALLERAEWDARLGRAINANLAEYLLWVNADVTDLTASSNSTGAAKTRLRRRAISSRVQVQ